MEADCPLSQKTVVDDRRRKIKHEIAVDGMQGLLARAALNCLHPSRPIIARGYSVHDSSFCREATHAAVQSWKGRRDRGRGREERQDLCESACEVHPVFFHPGPLGVPLLESVPREWRAGWKSYRLRYRS